MARVTIEDCIKNADDNRFDIVLAASKRAHLISRGHRPMVESSNDKPTVVALREIADNCLDIDAVLTQENLDIIV